MGGVTAPRTGRAFVSQGEAQHSRSTLPGPISAASTSRARASPAPCQAGGNTTGNQLRISARHRENGINFKSDRRRLDLVGARLFQVHRQTWLGTVKERARNSAYGNSRRHHRSASGTYRSAIPRARTAILELRDDPRRLFRDGRVLNPSNSFRLTGKIGHRPTPDATETHINGGICIGTSAGRQDRRLQNAERPSVRGALISRDTDAAANRSIFLTGCRDADRGPASVRGHIGARLQRLIAAEPATSPVTGRHTAVWLRLGSVIADPRRRGAAQSGKPGRLTGLFCRSFSRCTARFTPVACDASATATLRGVAAAGPAEFRSLFHAGRRAQPVRGVQELMGQGSSRPRTSPSRRPQLRARNRSICQRPQWHVSG